jgi:hypothetical protein
MAYRLRLSPEQRAERMKVIDEARQKDSRTELRDGREFVVVRIPDRYGEGPTGGRLDRETVLDTLPGAD